eukprot:scaffold64630_cov30-Tisochrysis_lutea.AAC.3
MAAGGALMVRRVRAASPALTRALRGGRGSRRGGIGGRDGKLSLSLSLSLPTSPLLFIGC